MYFTNINNFIYTHFRKKTEEQTEEKKEEQETVEEPKEMDLMTALREVLKKALAHDGLARGLREVCRAIDKRKAYFCVLADNCTEKQYKQLVEALTNEAKIDLIRVPDNLQLGEWVGLAKYDKSMKVRKAQKCSCVAVTDFGEESEELNFVLQSLKNKQELKQ